MSLVFLIVKTIGQPYLRPCLPTTLEISGGRELIRKAVQTELVEFLSQYQDKTDSEGKPMVVRNGYLPEREIMTGIDPTPLFIPDLGFSFHKS